MRDTDYIIINNRAYNAITGLPVQGVDIDAIARREQPAIIQQNNNHQGIETKALHTATQRSQTLSRRYVKKPINLQPIAQPEVAPQAQTTTQPEATLQAQTIAQPSVIIRQEPLVHIPPTAIDRASEVHPVAIRAAQKPLDKQSPRRKRIIAQQKYDIVNQQIKNQTPATKKALKPAHILKNEAIYEAMNKELNSNRNRAKRQKRRSWQFPRLLAMGSSSLAIVLLAGYFTYLSMPNLSIRMAAIQSGIDAKYPDYSPEGYALNGPISYKKGQVSMKFAYNKDQNQNFTIKQESSNWDSSAVREHVNNKTNSSTVTSSNGLTIYTYDNTATWVNGGILYTIEGNTRLSNEQIRRIAGSL